MDFTNLKNKLKNIPTEYKSVPFWSWNNTLEKNELIRQIEEMHDKNIGGFIMHARTGLKDEYLGEKWFDCVETCLKKAKELEMEAWVYDENGWPSGFVGGKLLENENFRAQYLEYEILDKYDDNAFAVYEEKSNTFALIREKREDVEKYHTIYLRTSPSNSDILKAEVIDEFIKETHEKYYERFADYFGSVLKGFFTDEPQYYRWGTPYSDACAKEFEKRGEDVKEGLVYLFKSDMPAGYDFRTRYYNTMNQLYVTNFYKKLYDWCEEHGCMLTGHSVEEATLYTQMWGGADCMASYEYEHIPGVDYLGRWITNEFPYRQLGSAAEQLGKKFVLTENFACGGHDTTPANLKCIGEIQYFNGVNKMCQHLYPFSISAQGRIDHPPFFSRHSNWFDEFGEFNEHFNRLSYIVANTENVSDVALINPVRCIYMNYVRSEDFESVRTLETRFQALLTKFRENGVMYDLIDERILSRHGSVEGDVLVVGKKKYDKVVIPYMPSLSESTYEILRKYKGKLLIEECPKYIDGKEARVDLVSNYDMNGLLEDRLIKLETLKGVVNVNMRKSDIGEFVFVINTNDLNKSENGKEGDSKFRIKGISDKYKIFDIDTLTTIDMKDEYELQKFQSFVLLKEQNSDSAIKMVEKTNDITRDFAIESITENHLVLDKISISKDGVDYSIEKDLQPVFEDLLRENYNGDLFVRYFFKLNNLCDINLIMEAADYQYVKINDVETRLEGYEYDIYYRRSNISELVKIGTNTIEYKIHFYEHDGVQFALFDPLATESVRNCLYYDTSIENAYLKGDFEVGEDLSLSKRNGSPNSPSHLERNGYPFFRGEYVLSGIINKEMNKSYLLKLNGNFLVANVMANGKKTYFIYENEKDITELLNEGINDVKIVIKSSDRNLYGPHHDVSIEPDGVNPWLFTYRGDWKGGKPERYVEEYNSVPFGIDNLILTTLKNN